MPKFRKKPIVIEAVQVTDEMRKNGGPFPDWALPHLELSRTEKIENSELIHVRTLEGSMNVSPNDWLIQGVKGEVYPCKPDIFAATYEPEDSSEPCSHSGVICLDGFKTLADFKEGLKKMRPDWFTSTDAVGGDSCKATTETIKPE